MKDKFSETFVDDRGELIAFNDISEMKRCYLVSNFDKNTIRAFHKNKGENKKFVVIAGTVLFVKFFDGKEAERKVLSKGAHIEVKENEWNGWKALEEDTLLISFSNALLSERSDERMGAHELCSHPKCIWKVDDR